MRIGLVRQKRLIGVIGVSIFALVAVSGCVYDGLAGKGCVGCWLLSPGYNASTTVAPSYTTIVERPVVFVSGQGVDSAWGWIADHLRSCGVDPVRSWVIRQGGYRIIVNVFDDDVGHDRLYQYRKKEIERELFFLGTRSVSSGMVRREAYYIAGPHPWTPYGGYFIDASRLHPLYGDRYEAFQVTINAVMSGVCRTLAQWRYLATSSCQWPQCQEVQTTISLYGRWGGSGINSYWPPPPPPQEQHHKRDKKKKR